MLASRERPASLDAAPFALEPRCRGAPWPGWPSTCSSVAPAPARNVVVSLLAERVLRHPDSHPLGDLDGARLARGLLPHWPPPGDGKLSRAHPWNTIVERGAACRATPTASSRP